MKARLFAAAALTMAIFAHPALSAAQAPAPPAAQEVIKTVERLFNSMRSRDTAALRLLLAPDLVIVSSREGAGGPTVRRQTTPQFLQAIATSAEVPHERMWSPDVRIDGDLATLWAPYDFHIGSRFSHCGTDAFQLLRHQGTWVITGLAYTVRTTDCTAPPG